MFGEVPAIALRQVFDEAVDVSRASERTLDLSPVPRGSMATGPETWSTSYLGTIERTFDDGRAERIAVTGPAADAYVELSHAIDSWALDQAGARARVEQGAAQVVLRDAQRGATFLGTIRSADGAPVHLDGIHAPAGLLEQRIVDLHPDIRGIAGIELRAASDAIEVLADDLRIGATPNDLVDTGPRGPLTISNLPKPILDAPDEMVLRLRREFPLGRAVGEGYTTFNARRITLAAEASTEHLFDGTVAEAVREAHRRTPPGRSIGIAVAAAEQFDPAAPGRWALLPVNVSTLFDPSVGSRRLDARFQALLVREGAFLPEQGSTQITVYDSKVPERMVGRFASWRSLAGIEQLRAGLLALRDSELALEHARTAHEALATSGASMAARSKSRIALHRQAMAVRSEQANFRTYDARGEVATTVQQLEWLKPFDLLPTSDVRARRPVVKA